MKALVIGDCHGEEPEIPDEGFDIVLVVGDVCGGTEEMRSKMFEAADTEKEWYELYGEEEAKKAVENSIREGKEILEELDSLGVPVLVVPGNWDWTGENSEWSFLEDRGYPGMLEGFDNVRNLNFSSFNLEDWNIVGYGPCSGPEIPQYEEDMPEDDEELEQMEQDYRQTLQELRELIGEKPVILLSHNVPHGTELDMIDNEESPAHGRHYGSLVVRELLEEEEVFLNIAGHIHEGKGTEKVKDTTCMNTGLQSIAEIEIKGSKVIRTEFL